MQVCFQRAASLPGFGVYARGQVADLPESQAQSLVRAGLALPVGRQGAAPTAARPAGPEAVRESPEVQETDRELMFSGTNRELAARIAELGGRLNGKESKSTLRDTLWRLLGSREDL